MRYLGFPYDSDPGSSRYEAQVQYCRTDHFILKEHGAGASVPDLARRQGLVAAHTINRCLLLILINQPFPFVLRVVMVLSQETFPRDFLIDEAQFGIRMNHRNDTLHGNAYTFLH